MKLVFSSFPEFSDNALAILRSVLAEHLKVTCYWLYNDATQLPAIRAKATHYLGEQQAEVHFVKKNSPMGILHYLTATYIFETHGMFEQFPILPWQTKVNLWHGMPLKKIGRLSGNPIKLKMTYTISTAPIFDTVMSQAFEIKPEQVLAVGQPRNDFFFETTRFDCRNLFDNQDPCVAWLPTYRKSNVGDIRTDGVQIEREIGGLSIDELLGLDATLVAAKVNLVIKLHPMDVLNEQLKELPQFKRLVILTTTQFTDLNIEVNEFLNGMAALITDYSSVYFDYVLTKRPIGILQLDEAAYSQGRGFVNQDVETHFIGTKIQNLTEFKGFMQQVAARTLAPINAESAEYFNQYDQKGQNSRYLLKLVGLIE